MSAWDSLINRRRVVAANNAETPADYFPLSNSEFARFFDMDSYETNMEKYRVLPLDLPQMPPAGTAFNRTAAKLATRSEDVPKVVNLLMARALYDPELYLETKFKTASKWCRLVPGHTVRGEYGPKKADVMVIGKCPTSEEVTKGRNFQGPSSMMFWDMCQKVGFKPEEIGSWYVSNVVRWFNWTPDGGAMPAEWYKDCVGLLQQEMRILKPKYILCLGKDAVDMVIARQLDSTKKQKGKYSLDATRGRVYSLNIPTYNMGETPSYHCAQVMTCVHPAALTHAPEKSADIMESLELFCDLTRGINVNSYELDVDHRNIYTEVGLSKTVDEALAYEDEVIVAIDGEWHGDDPSDPGSYLRTVQFSWAPKKAACVVFTHAGGAPAFQPGLEAAVPHLKRLFLSDKVRIAGHFLRADIPWIYYKLGIDLREKYAPPEKWEDCKTKGGIELSFLAHSTDETQRFKLEELAARHANMARWDTDLANWRSKEAAALKKKDKQLTGYGECPAHILHPTLVETITTGHLNYACYDADGTRRLIDRLLPKVESDRFGNNCWPAYHTSHSASLAFLEMEMTGITVDVDRVKHLEVVFREAREKVLQEIRELANWPDFNPNSSVQACALMYGPSYARIKGVPISSDKIPPQANIQYLTPIMTTGQKSKDWAQVVASGEEDAYNPSCNSLSLAVLSTQSEVAGKIRDYRILSKIITTLLAPPSTDKQGEVLIDEDGEEIYPKGILSFLRGDGKIHSRFSQVLETGRAASADPNLMNLPKKREKEYSRIVGDHYDHPLRTILKASPGCVLMEADYSGAELAGIMWIANDPNGIDHIARGLLDSKDPNYYEIHSRQAVKCFSLDCAPTKGALKEAGFTYYREAAKMVNFGIPYGISAASISSKLREDKVDVSEDEAQLLIDGYFQNYPCVYDLLREIEYQVEYVGWLQNSFQRGRRFPPAFDPTAVAAAKREGKNFPIQSLVADAVSRAMYNLMQIRKKFSKKELDFRIVLQIHDAIILEVPFQFVKRVYEEIFHLCMIEQVPIYPRTIRGELIGTGPYHFSSEKGIYLNWGEPLEGEQLSQFGLL
jgi:uracil-DNA glycosylase family 4